MLRLVAFVVAGLLLGAVAHIAIVLLVPLFATSDAWSRVAALNPPGAFHVVDPNGTIESGSARDPALMEAVCRFTLDSGPIRVAAVLPQGFWSVALFDRQGRNVYSYNDRSADPLRLDLAILTVAQAAAFGDAPPDAIANAVVAELPVDTGLVVIRVFVRDEASLPEASRALAAADCNAPI